MIGRLVVHVANGMRDDWMSGSAEADEEPRTLIDAAFIDAFRPAALHSILTDMVPTLMGSQAMPPTLTNIFVPMSNDCLNGPSLRSVTAVSELADGSGLMFDWEGPSLAPIPLPAMWDQLCDLPVPGLGNGDPHVERLVRSRAKALWDAVTVRFGDRIQSGEVQLLARRGSPFAEPTPVPKAAAPFVQVVDWFNGTAEVAGEQLFDVRVAAPHAVNQQPGSVVATGGESDEIAELRAKLAKRHPGRKDFRPEWEKAFEPEAIRIADGKPVIRAAMIRAAEKWNQSRVNENKPNVGLPATQKGIGDGIDRLAMRKVIMLEHEAD